ncbi:PAS domain S-box protein [Zeimonas arvi]|uniref:PAS domain S-box protein n=1 Tax=Zeimonas arvi TaxID=2498847 RepID=A0A5C8NRK8_9BURK|nr:PAS domain S-box protein [Zeimonas arvi]TXL63521.1 PAS domain S-box protein [Zeimonas arvi]
MSSQRSLDEVILGQLAEAVVYADRGGVIRRWNAAATAMFGFTAAEAIGQRLDLIIPEHLREAHWRGFDLALARGRTRLGGRPTLTRALHRSGRRLYVEMSFALVVDDGGVAQGSVAVARDATGRIEREKAARAGAAAPR